MSVATSRTTAGLPLRLHSTDESTQELPIDMRSDRVNVNVLSSQELTSIFDMIDSRRFELNFLESGRLEFGAILVLLHRTSHTADPRKDALTNLTRYIATGDDIGDGDATSRLQYAECFPYHSVFVSREIDDAIGDDDIDRRIRQWNVLNLSFQELYILNSRPPLVLVRESQHFVSHVQPV